MGSKKHKKHKSERRERYEDIGFSLERPPSLKLILKVSGNNSTPEYSNDSPSYDIQHNNNNENLVEYINTAEYVERRKKSKKKKKKKDREKKRKHKRMKYNDDSSQEDVSANEDTPQLHDTIIRYTGMTTTNCLSSTPVTRAIQPLKPREISYSEERHFSQSPPSSTVVPATSSTTTISPQSQSTSKVYAQQFPAPIGSGGGGGGAGGFSGGETSSPSISKELSPVNSFKSIDNIKSPTSSTGGGGGGGDGCVTREPRTCVLKLKQSKTPLSKLLDHLLRSLEKKDPHQFFAWPVTDDIAPGYSSIISEPMDFLSIRQKVDENQYGTLPEFIDDFKLMCENAIKYNHSDTVYHKAAKRLLHIGGRMLQPESLIRSLRPLMMYLKELNSRELGFVLEHQHENQENENHIVDSADEGMSTGAEELGNSGGAGGSLSSNLDKLMDDTTRDIKNENLPETKFEPFVDDLTPEEILQQVQNAAKIARNRMISERQRARKMGFLRQKKDGTTSMKILVNVDNDLPERVVSLGTFTGKLQQGTGLLQGFREDRRNNAKIVKPLNYGQFCSYAPIFDSRFSNLSKEETELILNTYGDENCTDYAESIMEFTRDSSYAYTLANRLLDVLTNGEHSKAISQLIENQHQRYDQSEIDKLFPQTTIDTNENQLSSNGNKMGAHEQLDSSKIDFESLKSLNELGVDVSFLQPLEQTFRLSELHRKLEKQLHTNSTLIERLQQVQTERLSQPLPQHLSYVAHPNTHEIELAVQITTNLTEMAKQLPPESISTQHALRKAMGLSDVGLPPIVHSRLNLNSILLANGCTPINEETINLDMDTTPVQMDLESEPICSTENPNARASSASSSSQVDLENELREFLEGGGTNLTHGDDVAIEQMLLG